MVCSLTYYIPMCHVTMKTYIMLLFLTNNRHTVFSITFVISLLSSEISQGIYDFFRNAV